MTVKNPIQKSKLFVTPGSITLLNAIAETYKGGEKAAFYMAMALTSNLCSDLFDKAIAQDTPLARGKNDDGE